MRINKWYILAGGSATRWKGYQGVKNKCYLKIDGETLVDRTIRLLEENGQNNYEVVLEGYGSKREAFEGIARKEKGPFGILLCDCYYTEAIIKVRSINGQPLIASAVGEGNYAGVVIDNVAPTIWETGVVPTEATTKTIINLPLMAQDVLKNFDWFIYVDGKYKGQDLSFKINTIGEHTIRAYAVDEMGNMSYKEYQITIS